jgi:putative intracellular protease/amidase
MRMGWQRCKMSGISAILRRPAYAPMILCLLPEVDYDPTECAVPWQALQQAGIEVGFATPDGRPAHADPRLVEQGFGPLNPFLMTRKADIATYRAMTASTSFQHPRPYAKVRPEDYEGLLIPGGHAAGMRTMLESERAREIVLHFFEADKPVAAVCHGVLLLARTLNPATGRSVIHGRKLTALPALNMELMAWSVTAPWLGSYYRTYPQTVESEVKGALASDKDFMHGPFMPMRDSATQPQRGFVVRDGQLLTARWPGDCHRFGQEFVQMLTAVAA